MKQLVLGLIVSLGLMILAAYPTGALPAVKVQPLLYEERLEPGEIKKGFIDITNPTGAELKIDTSVEAFRQIDDRGSLEFFESEPIAAGITPDFEEITLGPGQTMRMAFEVNGSKLPQGDVFAGLFFTAEAGGSENIAQALRVGTLFIIENGTTAVRSAEITGLQVPLISFNQEVNGQYSIKNTDSGQLTGFRPEVTLSLQPFSSSKTHQAGLVFSGRERANDFSIDTNRLGIYRLTASYGDSSMSRYVVLLPWYVWFVIGGTVLVIGVWATRRLSKSRHKYKRNKL